MAEEELEKEALKLKPTNRIVTWPNLVSLFRLISIPFIAVLISHDYLLWGLVLLAFSALTDALDGFLARKLNQITKLGQILDPIADRLLIFCSILALGTSGFIPWWFLLVVGARDLMLGVVIIILAQFGYGPLPVHFVGKTATAMIMADIPLLMISGLGTAPIFGLLATAGTALAIWGVVMYWIAGIIYVRQAIGLVRGTLREQRAAH
ncbi:CDP-alcohol phosphatidyltransferase family protein [Alloscardovia venturai]|uniref:CDP-alcohol phosphatidyltransferase family protein n=1 Tax=Alloscardovia venturai TaxID=1769421 RepID=A0ABW2Y3X3_9BIFI